MCGTLADDRCCCEAKQYDLFFNTIINLCVEFTAVYVP